MRVLRWLAIVPLLIGLWILVFGLIWSEAGLILLAIALIAVAATVWRAFDGAWPFAARTALEELSPSVRSSRAGF